MFSILIFFYSLLFFGVSLFIFACLGFKFVCFFEGIEGRKEDRNKYGLLKSFLKVHIIIIILN